MSITSIEAHHQKWAALPAFPAWPYVMDDSDVEAWGDLLYMRGLVDTIADVCARTGTRITDMFPPHFSDDSVVFNPDSPACVPWPADRAGQLLDEWRADREQVAA